MMVPAYGRSRLRGFDPAKILGPGSPLPLWTRFRLTSTLSDPDQAAEDMAQQLLSRHGAAVALHTPA
jgi:hypothetical protein